MSSKWSCCTPLLLSYHCFFGLLDNSHLVPKDMEPLLDSTLKKRKNTYEHTSKNRRGKKVVPKYDVFPTTVKTKGQKKQIGKTWTCKPIKSGYLCGFYAKQPYSYNMICYLIYRHSDHLKKDKLVVHNVSVTGFKDNLGSTISNGMKQHLSNLLWLSFFPSQMTA